MDQSPISKRSLIISVLFALIILSFIYVSNLFDKSTKLIFCNVGQGDAAYIRVKNKVDILVDAGPNRDILNCLGRYMPYFDKKIEIAILTHPQKDHLGGYIDLIDRYKIDKFLMLDIDNPSMSYQMLIAKLKDKKISIYHPTKGEKIKILNDEIEFLWPTFAYINNLNVLGTSTLKENDLSLIFLFKEGRNKVLFTGDTSSNILDQLGQKNISILKIPHHGSKYGLSMNFFKSADPILSVISVGKNNSYGHPSKELLSLLKALNKKYLRTDEKGDIVIRLQ